MQYLLPSLTDLNMKVALCLLIFSVAIAIIFAETQYEYDEDEYDDDEEYELAPQEDTHLSLFQLIEGLEELEHEMTVVKRGRKNKSGRRRKSKHRKNRNKIGRKLRSFTYSLRFFDMYSKRFICFKLFDMLYISLILSQPLTYKVN